MPYKSKRPCNYPGCPKLAIKGYCEDHTKVVNKDYDNNRETATQRGYDHRWHKRRNMKLNEDPLCERCKKKGLARIATLVHHKDRNPKNNSNENLESLCGTTKIIKKYGCHDIEHKGERFKKRQ